MSFTKGKNAPGYCERCQLRWPLAKLRFQVEAGKLTDLLVCPDCLDKDQPQLLLGRLRVRDPQSIRRPAQPNETQVATMGQSFVLGSSKLE